MAKLIYKEKIGNKRIIHIFGIKFSYKKKETANKPNFCKIKTYIKEVLKNNNNIRKLVVIPSDPIKAYDNKGIDWLQSYYNPNRFFDEVFLLSPLEKGINYKYGMHVIGVDDKIYKKALKLIKPDVIRAYGGYWATTFAIKNKTENTPIVSSIHDDRESLFHKEVDKADYVICMSQACANLAKNRGIPDSKIIIMPNRVDLNTFKKTIIHNKGFKKEHDKYNILSVGRLTSQKNIDNNIRALQFLPENYSITFVGRGSNKQYCKLAQECGVLNRVNWIETIKNSDLPYYYSTCDVFCTPSRSEGFGIVFIEAAACNTPIITSDIKPMNEYLTHNKDSYLIKEFENPKEIAKAIKFVCKNKEYSKLISNNSRLAAEKFDKRKIDKLEADIYSSIINKNKP